MSAPTKATTTNDHDQAASPIDGGVAAPPSSTAAPAPAPGAIASLQALYAGYDDAFYDNDDDDDGDGNAFGDAFTAVLARVPELMGAVVAWAREAEAGGGGDREAATTATATAAAEALEALSSSPLLPDDVLGGERWLDLCEALPVCLFSGGGGGQEEEEGQGKADPAVPATAAARLLRFLSPAVLAGSGSCVDALATLLIPLLNYMSKAGACSSGQFSVRRHAEAAAQASSSSSSAAAEAPDAIALQFALVGLHRLGRQWHLLDPGLGPGLAAGICALLAAPLSASLAADAAADGDKHDDDDEVATAMTTATAAAAQALLAWEPEAAWWYRLCAVTSSSVDLAAAAAAVVAVAAAGGGAQREPAPPPPPPPLPLLRVLVRRRWGARTLTSLDAVASHVLTGVLGAPALRRALFREEEEERRGGARGGGGGGGDGEAAAAAEEGGPVPPPPPPPPLLEVLLQLATAVPPQELDMAEAARVAARSVVLRLVRPAAEEGPRPAPPARWAATALAAVAASV